MSRLRTFELPKLNVLAMVEFYSTERVHVKVTTFHCAVLKTSALLYYSEAAKHLLLC